jgi:hypothetical protein
VVFTVRFGRGEEKVAAAIGEEEGLRFGWYLRGRKGKVDERGRATWRWELLHYQIRLQLPTCKGEGGGLAGAWFLFVGEGILGQKVGFGGSK